MRGFTLVELLVVISLMSVLMLSSIGVFFSYTRSQSFQVSVTDVIAFLNKAKSRAITQIKPQDCGEDSLASYEVFFDLSGSEYSLKANCKGQAFLIETRKLPSQIIFDETSASSVIFNSYTGIVPSPAEVIITGFGESKTIGIDAVGNISIKL